MQEIWNASPAPKLRKAPTEISADLTGMYLAGSLFEAMPLENSSCEFLGEADVAGLRIIMILVKTLLAVAIAAGSTARKISDPTNCKIIWEEEEEIEQIQ